MKKILILVIALISFNSLSAQNEGRAVKKGDHTVNVYYGYSLTKSVIKAFVPDSVTGVSVTGLGPMGLVYENLITDGIGLGLELSYSSTAINYQDKSTDPQTNTVQTYDWKLKVATTRIFIRANFHFAKSEKFDAYFLVGAGYKNRTYSVTTNDPDYNNEKTSFTLVPYGMKPGLGLRYFFTPNFGINAEIAAGTPLMSAGLSVKF